MTDAFRTEEHWGEKQSGMHNPDARQREPLGGMNERACSKCGVMLMVHVRGVCPVVQRKEVA